MSSNVTQTTAEIAVVQEQGTDILAQPRRRSHIAAWLFILPAILLQLVWGWYPLVVAFVISFTDGQTMVPSTFTGLQSYTRLLLHDPLVGQAFRVTFFYASLTITLTFVLPILVAILLMEMPPKVMRWFMLLWFLPLSTISSVVFWKYIYNAQYGLFESIATHLLHFPPQPFLNDANQVVFWLVFPGLLLFGPGLIYMAGLQSIPASYYEAAEVEGASFWRKVWTISLPRLRPIIAMLLTFSIISSMQEFTWPQMMTDGQPGGASRTVVMYMYILINSLRQSDATALSIMLFLVIMALTILFRFLVREDPDA